MPKFTVVVLFPENYRTTKMDTYTAHVEADDAQKARIIGAREAHLAHPPAERGKLDSWLPLVVFKGHQHVKAWGWQAPDWRSQ